MSERPSRDPDPFEKDHYADTMRQKLKRSTQLGSKYYLWDLPRYFLDRRRLQLPLRDLGVIVNPFREFSQGVYSSLELPPGYQESLQLLEGAGVRLALPRGRLEALLGAWWTTHQVHGDVIECGSFRGATALLLGLLGKLNRCEKLVLMLDTFRGSPEVSGFDNTRTRTEFIPPTGQVDLIRRQATTLGIGDQIEIHPGLFSETFDLLQDRNLTFSFCHVDANIYSGTKEACEFTIPRISPGGIVVFDDYNGICDLGARLAIDQFFLGKGAELGPLAGSSVLYRRPRVSSGTEPVLQLCESATDEFEG